MRCLLCGIAVTEAMIICPNPDCRCLLEAQRRDLLPVGTLLADGRYRIEYALGRGGFGITYRAIHTNLHQPVAIKECFPANAYRVGVDHHVAVSGADEADYRRGLQRFVREGHILARLEHPHIVRVRDLFEARGTAYLVMELVPGQTLRQAINERPHRTFTEDEVKTLVGALVSALATTHAEGIYHLDIKPENILLTPTGAPVLLDFGAARQQHTATGSLLAFTPAYAPPELGAGDYGRESDIYSLAVLVYELLGASGRPAPRSAAAARARIGSPPRASRNRGAASCSPD